MRKLSENSPSNSLGKTLWNSNEFSKPKFWINENRMRNLLYLLYLLLLLLSLFVFAYFCMF